MKFSNTAPYHLSNYEVLQHFLSLKKDNDELQSLQSRYKDRNDKILKNKYPLPEDQDDDDDRSYKKDKRKKKTIKQIPIEVVSEEEARKEQIAIRRGISDELVWLTDSVINYLCGDVSRTARQTPEGVEQLVHSLQNRSLVKAEVLQITNLLPTDAAELYCVIEDAETRFGYETNDILDAIRADINATLLPEPPADLQPFVAAASSNGLGDAYTAGHYDGHEGDYEEEEMEQYVHEAEWGAGKEVGVGDEEEDPME